MRYLIFLILVCLNFNIISAQKIDESWFLKTGVKIAQVHTFDPDLSQVDLETFGVGQVWDFSHEDINDLVDTTEFIDPSEAVFKDHYPNANLVKQNLNPLYDWEWYYRVEEDTTFRLGESYIKHVGNLIDTFIQIRETGFENIHAYKGFTIGDQYWANDNEIESFTFQGYGTIITSPTDTFEHSILIKRNFIPTGTVKYYWYQSDFTREICVYTPAKPPLFETNSLTRMVYYEDLNSTSSLHSLPKKLDNINFGYAQGEILITNESQPKDVLLSVYTLNGDLLLNQNMNLMEGDNYHPFQIDSELSILVVLCVDKKNNQFVAQKIFVD